MLHLQIDPHSGVPVYRQMMDQVKYYAASGILKTGDQLPSIRELARALSVNPRTAEKAYGELQQEGVVELRQRGGAFGCEPLAYRLVDSEFEPVATMIGQREELDSVYTQLDRQCRSVGRIQQSLVPQEEPVIGGFAVATHYKTAWHASGDYYDFLPQADGRWGVIVADVSGHGVPAAVIMAITRTILHALPRCLSSPAEALQRTNGHLHLNIPGSRFVTAFFALLDLQTSRLQYASAGHNPPLFFSARTSKVTELSREGGLPLAFTDDAAFPEHEVPLDPGDVLLLYTDGIVETFNPVAEIFGKRRLGQAVAAAGRSGAAGVRDTVVEQVTRFEGGRAVHDDQTLVVLEKL